MASDSLSNSRAGTVGLFKPIKKLPITRLRGDFTMMANEVIFVSRLLIEKCLRASLSMDFTCRASISSGNFFPLKKEVTVILLAVASSTEISALIFALVRQIPSSPIQVQNAADSVAV